MGTNAPRKQEFPPPRNVSEREREPGGYYRDGFRSRERLPAGPSRRKPMFQSATPNRVGLDRSAVSGACKVDISRGERIGRVNRAGFVGGSKP